MARKSAAALAPRKRPAQERAQATVDAILGATAHILVTDGFDRLSTNKVAARAGVSIGSLYQYFPSKDALVAALAERHHDEMLSVLGGALAAIDVDAAGGASLEDAVVSAVTAAVSAMLDAHALDPALHRAISEGVPRSLLTAHLEETTLDVIRGWLERHRDRIGVADVDAGAFVIVSLVEGVAHNAVLHRPELLGAPLKRELVAMITRYLRLGDRRG